MSLNDEQITKYHDEGYLTGLTILSDDEARNQRMRLEELESQVKSSNLPGPASSYFRANAHYVTRQAAELVHHPVILDAVSSLLGPDLLAWSAEFFIKEANTEQVVTWHQDLTYWGLGPTEGEITAWLALSDVSVESGCMRFLPGSHHNDILSHKDTFSEHNLLSRGQALDVEIDETKAVDIVLKPGQMSLHHGRIFHASGPNRSNDRRIGLAIRYLRPDVKQLVSQRDYAMLVRGWDRSNHFIPVSPPAFDFDPESLARREQILKDQSIALGEGAAQDLRRS